ncbi:hypothetical protein Tco_0619868 [Tanacetum coccineum]
MRNKELKLIEMKRLLDSGMKKKGKELWLKLSLLRRLINDPSVIRYHSLKMKPKTIAQIGEEEDDTQGEMKVSFVNEPEQKRKLAIHMLTEKKYPLSQEMLTKMLSRKLEVDHESSQAFELLRNLGISKLGSLGFGFAKQDIVMSDSEDSTITYTAVSSPFEGLSDIGSPGVDGPPMMPEDPYAYVVAAFQAPPSSDYVPGPEEPEQAPLSPEFVSEPVYSEFMPPEDEVLPAEEQPLPAAVSPSVGSPRYIPESDPEEDPEEDPTINCLTGETMTE